MFSPEAGGLVDRSNSWRFVWRSGLILAIVFLTLASPGRRQCAGECACTNQGVAIQRPVISLVTAVLPGVNDVALNAIDTNVWSLILGTEPTAGKQRGGTYCGPPGYTGNPTICPNNLSTSNNAYMMAVATW